MVQSESETLWGSHNEEWDDDDDDNMLYLYSIEPYFKVLLCPKSLTARIRKKKVSSLELYKIQYCQRIIL